MRTHRYVCAVPALLALMACSSNGGSGSGIGSQSQSLVSLVPLANCDEVERVIRDTAIAEMNRVLDENLNKRLTGCAYGEGMERGDMASPSAGAPGGGAGNSSSDGEHASSASSTNNQVAGVDEADFIKNDDKYIYAAAGNRFRIVQAWPANDARELSSVELKGKPLKLFVQGDRALVYSSVEHPASTTGGRGSPYYGSGRECTYGSDCDFTGDGTMTHITVFDIANRAAPRKVRELELSGSLIGARRIGSGVHTVVAEPDLTFPNIQTTPPSMSSCATPNEDTLAVRAAYENLRAANIEIIRTTSIQDRLPTISDTANNGVGAGCSGYYRATMSDGGSFTSLVSLDLSTEQAPTGATIVSRPGVVYASAESLYMAVPHQRVNSYPWFDEMAELDEASTVHKFRISERPADTGYTASGVVKGRVLNQFALDEYQSNLRIATTSGHLPDLKAHNTLSILGQTAHSLTTLGVIDHIAPSEDIRSVRFDGERGFVVTFKKTDPLYVFSLSDPHNPSILGELKIPGFSTYMHMMDATHLLTIGYDADDQGDFAWFAGVMLQIFDVSNPNDPKLLHKERIGTRGSSSEALTNHLAFNYFQPKNLLALPMTICEGGNGGSFGTNMTFSGLMVYDVTEDAGFHLRGRVPHPNNSTNDGYNNGACSNWWTNANSEVKRSVIMDDVVYSISQSVIKVANIDSLGAPIAEIAIGP